MSTRRALAFSFIDRYAGLVLTIVSSMIIARLLTPAEIGVYSVTMVLLTFISSLRDMGAGQYLLQEKELTQDRIRATWSVQLGLGILFAIVVLCAAHPVATFYKEPRIVGLMYVLAFNFAISPFGSITYAWLMREMRFDLLAIMRFIAGLTGATVSVTLAWRGYGPMSLAIGSLMSTIANACVATLMRPAHLPWLPGTHGIRRVLSFGSKISLTTVLNNVAGSTPDALLAKFVNMSATAYFSRANGLATMFNKLVIDAIQAVALPLFADESRRFGTIAPTFLQATAYVTALGWSFFLFIEIFAGPVIGLLYGPQWTASVGLTRSLSLGMAVGLPSVFVGIALTSVGQVGLLSRLTLAIVAQYVVTIAIGAYFGLATVGYAFIVASTVNSILWLAIAKRVLKFDLRDFLAVLGQSLLVAGVTGLPPIAVRQLAPLMGTGEHAQLLISAPFTIVAFLGAVVALKHPLAGELSRFTSMLRPRKFG